MADRNIFSSAKVGAKKARSLADVFEIFRLRDTEICWSAATGLCTLVGTPIDYEVSVEQYLRCVPSTGTKTPF